MLQKAHAAVRDEAPGRPMRAVGDPPLLERAAELGVLGDALASATSGRGAVIVLEAAAGLGKTALLDHVERRAAAAGCDVRRAAPGPFERHFPYGVIRTLLETPLRAASERERERMLQGAAGDAGRLLLGERVPDGDETTMVAHSIFWLCSALAATRPLVLVVDDAQWSDRASLEVLAYLARRIEQLPILIAVAARGDDPDAPSDLLSLLGGARAATVLRPQPLTLWGAVALVRRHAPDTSLRVCRDCGQAVGGSPWLLDELGRQIAAYGAAPLGAGAQSPHTVRESRGAMTGPAPVTAVARDMVRLRLAALSPNARAVAAALAILGHGAPPQVVAALAGLAIGELAPARDALRSAGLLAGGRARFAHDLIATAIVDDLAGTERERLHREAARLLADSGASIASVAGHLLECDPHGDAEVTALLVRAAADAAERNAPRAAAAYLDRALRERADGDDRGGMLAKLAAAAFDAELPDARRRLHDSLSEPHDRESRIDVLTRLAALQGFSGGDEKLAGALEHATAREGDPAARAALDVASLDAFVARSDRHAERAATIDKLGAVALPDPALARAVSAHRAWAAVELGSAPAEACAALALEALDGDVLLREAGRRSAYHLAVRTLILTDQHARARSAIDALLDEAATRRSRRLRASAAWYAAELALRTGDVLVAQREATTALELAGDDLRAISGGALEVLIRALAERGAFEEAQALLSERGLDGDDVEVGIRDARARLYLATGDYERAYAEASEAGMQRERQGCSNPAVTRWRSTAALALAHLGRRDEAVVLADEDVTRAERFGAPVPLVSALHARAVAEAGDDTRLTICRRALGVAGAVTAVLDTVRIRLELGSTLSRQGARVAARDQLRPALAEADAVGAMPLAARARRELVATGLRPRQAAIEGAAALTPRQREICSLAAAGKGNREIAQALFLSIKTVETHLAAGYRKLGISSREDLATALG
jgi:DNA-binding CsgD family transcriptional regulator